MNPVVYFVENLTLSVWALAFWLRLLKNRLRGAAKGSRCYVVGGSSRTMFLAKVLAPLTGVDVEKLDFRLIDIRDEDGLLIFLRLTHQDLEEVQRDATNEPVFQDLIQRGLLRDRSAMFLAKGLVEDTVMTRGSLRKAMFLVHVCLWKVNGEPSDNPGITLVLERRPGLGAITRYATKYGVEILPVRPSTDWRSAVYRRVPKKVKGLVRRWRLRNARHEQDSREDKEVFENSRTGSLPLSTQPMETSDTRVAVQFYGHLNIDSPERHSDLAFWQMSPLRGADLLVNFGITKAPINQKTWAALAEHGIGALALNPGSTTVSAVPVFSHRAKINRRQLKHRLALGNSDEAAWICNKLASYEETREYWTHLVDEYRVKVYVTWFKYDGQHMAIADALQESGGVTAVYQRSFEPLPSPEGTVGADIGFGFSSSAAEVELDSNSIIKYQVVTGYVGDHRYPLLNADALRLREQMQSKGASRIVSFTDENSLADLRWHPGHPFVRENYAFLLEKVLSNPWFGLVIKPKTPHNLRQRLGPVAETLRQAEATGRCYVYEEGPLQGSFPPAAAGLAADIAVHGHLSGGTAAVDQVLAGTPTLLMDREGWSINPLYKLGVGRVVFNDWDNLWEACLEHWDRPEGTPGFADWSPMLDEIDPFRDGRASERMGNYIKWLVDGFRAGQDRDTVMADAAERYCNAWGSDKVTQVNGKPLRVATATAEVAEMAARS